MIKSLTNIFYVKYVMDDIVTFNKEIGEENNFGHFCGVWFNPKYLYENKYMLYLNYYSNPDYRLQLVLKDKCIEYINLYTHKCYCAWSGENGNLTFSKFPNDLNVAIINSAHKLVDYYNFNKYFENFIYELYHIAHNHGPCYFYLIKRKEEFKSII